MSNITLNISRGIVIPFADLPANSIALDGYVQGPQVDNENRKYSFDHHDNCVRFATRASCAQVLDALALGLDPTGMSVFVNDIDGDTAMAVWLLMNPGKAQRPDVRHLVANVAFMDAHGPAYPVPDGKITRAFFDGAMAPERDARRNKTYGSIDLESLLQECLSNVDKLLKGEIKISTEEKSYEVIYKGVGDWVIAKSDNFIFDKLYEDGVTKAIACKQLPDGSWQYTVGKKSEFVDGFPIGPVSKDGTILHTLNNIEPGWGGGSTIGGSPRNKDGSSSKLTPVQVFEVVEKILR